MTQSNPTIDCDTAELCSKDGVRGDVLGWFDELLKESKGMKLVMLEYRTYLNPVNGRDYLTISCILNPKSDVRE